MMSAFWKGKDTTREIFVNLYRIRTPFPLSKLLELPETSPKKKSLEYIPGSTKVLFG